MAKAGRLTQPERVATSRERLLDAASTLFIERGYHATSAGDIAALAGYSREMVRVRFGSKLGLAQELVRVEFQQAQHLDVDPTLAAIEVLEQRADRLDQLSRDAPVRVRASFVLGFESAISVPELEEDFSEWMARGQRDLEADVGRAVCEGSVRPVDPAEIAMLLHDAATGGAYRALRSGKPEQAAHSFRSILDLIRSDGTRSAPESG